MELFEQSIKKYIASVTVPPQAEPNEIKKIIEDNADITAGMFLKRLKELKISGSEFLELLGNSKIGNMEFRRIEENPHLKFDELLSILDNSVLDSDDYRMIISVASQRQAIREERKKREEETLLRVEREEKERAASVDDDTFNPQPEIQEQSEQPVSALPADNDTEPKKSLSAAEEIFAKALADVEKQLEEEYEDSDFSDESLEETIEFEKLTANNKGSEFSSEQENEDYDAEDEDDADYSDEQTDNTDENDGYDDFESFLEGETIGSSAKDIGYALGDLVGDSDGENDSSDEIDGRTTGRRSRACLVAAFVGVIVLFGCAGALKALRYFEIIPEYVYEIPEIIRQEITDFPSLLNEANGAEGRVSYELPQEFILQQTEEITSEKNAVGEKLAVAIYEENGKKYICGATCEAGKLGESFSFATELVNPSVMYIGGRFAVIGTKGGQTVARFYDESTITGGKPVKEYKQSGNIVGCYTVSNEVYLITYQSFGLSSASADNLTSFIPSFEMSGKKSVVPFASIIRPETVNKLNYYTVARISPEGDDVAVKAVLCGDMNGFAVSESGFYSCDGIKLNDKYTTRISRIAFDKDLSSSYVDFNGAINPSMLFASGERVAAAGIEQTEGGNVNVVLSANAELSSQSVMSGVAAGRKISAAYSGEKVLTLVSDGESPMQYNINLNDMSMAEKAEESSCEIGINDKYYAQVKIASDGNGERTGVTLSMLDTDKKTIAEVTACASSTVQGNWNSYLSSAAADDISKLAVYSVGEKIFFGLPLVYFDGISQVSEYKFYSFEKDKLAEIGNIALYDEKYSTMFCGMAGGDKPYIITMWDNRIITAGTDKIKVISDTVIKPEAEDEKTEG